MPQFCLISSTCCYQCQLVQFITCSPKSWSCAAFRGQTVRENSLCPTFPRRADQRAEQIQHLENFFSFHQLSLKCLHWSDTSHLLAGLNSELESVLQRTTAFVQNELNGVCFCLFCLFFFLLCCSPFLSPNLKVVFSSIVSKFIDPYYYFIYC